MALPEELTGFADTVTCPCGEELPLKVLRSNAYYIGRFCPKCGPYSRESRYFKKRGDANAELALWKSGFVEQAGNAREV